MRIPSAVLIAVLGPALAAQSTEVAPGRAADAPQVEYDPIAAYDIADHIDVLASDLLEGRAAGSKGAERARDYIVSWLEEASLLEPGGPDGSWFQDFEVPSPDKTSFMPARNVLALLRGSDPELAEQLIVVGAHYDHVGLNASGNALDFLEEGIRNGADDNASGTSVVLEMALAMASRGERPRHSIMFQWYSGEELGLVGSKHWVSEPTWPIDDVIAMLNLDMVGRLRGNTLMVGATGCSPGFEELAYEFGEELGLTIYSDRAGQAPSDNTSFYDAGIPALFLFTGLHRDYHRVGDDAHKINIEGAELVGRYALRWLEHFDSLDEPPPFQLAPGAATLFNPRVYVGISVRDARPVGAEVSILIPDSPAAEAGVAEGDVITHVDGEAIADGAVMAGYLKALDPNLVPFELTILRPELDEFGDMVDAERLTVTITPRIK